MLRVLSIVKLISLGKTSVCSEQFIHGTAYRGTPGWMGTTNMAPGTTVHAVQTATDGLVDTTFETTQWARETFNNASRL